MSMFGPAKRSTFHDYAAPTQLRPTWRVAYFVYQAGDARIRLGSMTGGGQVYGHEFTGMFSPLLTANSTPVNNYVGGGQVVSTPPEILALLGGVQGVVG